MHSAGSAVIMRAVDQMPVDFRALVHEYGVKIVDAMMAEGYSDAAELRDVLETWRERRQREWLSAIPFKVNQGLNAARC